MVCPAPPSIQEAIHADCWWHWKFRIEESPVLIIYQVKLSDFLLAKIMIGFIKYTHCLTIVKKKLLSNDRKAASFSIHSKKPSSGRIAKRTHRVQRRIHIWRYTNRNKPFSWLSNSC